MTRFEIVEVMQWLRDAYPRQQITEGQLAVYADMLADVPVDAARAAVRRHVQTSAFFPAVSEIRALAAAVETERRCARCHERVTAARLVDGRLLCETCYAPRRSELATAVEVRTLVEGILAKVRS